MRPASLGYRLLIRHNASKSRSKISFENFESNKTVEPLIYERLYLNRFVTDQRKLSDMKLGNSDMGYAGCEIISVYNALMLLRDVGSISKEDDEKGSCGLLLSNMIRKAETGGFLVRFGLWGTNPLWLPEFAAGYGLRLSKCENTLPRTTGIYILSFWNNRRLSHGAHTVCMEFKEDHIMAYNYHYSDKPLKYDHARLEEEFVANGKSLIAVFKVVE